MTEAALLIVLGIGFLIVAGIAALFAKFYLKVEQGKALIVNKMGAEPEVTFTGMIVLPVLNKSEVMDISVKTIEIDRRGKEGLICRDNIRADIKVTFFVRVNKTRDDVIKVAQAIGCARACDQNTLEELFNAKFSEALKTVGKQLDFTDLYTKRNEFRDRIVEVIGRDLNGYVLEDAAIDYLEQTPLGSLDRDNILDAQGIRKITELTSLEHVRTNEFTNGARKQIKKQDVEAAEAILELERQQSEAVSRQKREVETVAAREQAEIVRVQAEERFKMEAIRIKADEEIAVQEENKLRQIEIARKNRERIIAVETERVEKDRQLEEVARVREVELQRIAKEKALEIERKAIADVVRERIAVERTVAQQEEHIKELRVVEEAKRLKVSAVIAAEAEAEEKLVKDIKAAEAAAEAAKHWAAERLISATSELEAAEKSALAKIKVAEGVQAETAAKGLAEVRVKEAQAQAVEKIGLAEAAVLRERGSSEAHAVRERGLAEAQSSRERFSAEAAGIAQKAEAMRFLDEVGREHEEFRLRLDNERAVSLHAIDAQKAVAESQAKVLASALQNARIEFIGGDPQLAGRILNGISLGKTMDGFLSRSDTVRDLVESLGTYLSAGKNAAAEK